MNLEIVGHCPDCNAPLYGLSELEEGRAPVLVRSCRCASGTDRQVASFGPTERPAIAAEVESFMATFSPNMPVTTWHLNEILRIVRGEK
jgi:hypothetical protein